MNHFIKRTATCSSGYTASGKFVGYLVRWSLSSENYGKAFRLRSRLAETGQTIPNQINEPATTPPMRWVFQSFEGIELLQVDTRAMTTPSSYACNRFMSISWLCWVHLINKSTKSRFKAAEYGLHLSGTPMSSISWMTVVARENRRADPHSG